MKYSGVLFLTLQGVLLSPQLMAEFLQKTLKSLQSRRKLGCPSHVGSNSHFEGGPGRDSGGKIIYISFVFLL